LVDDFFRFRVVAADDDYGWVFFGREEVDKFYYLKFMGDFTCFVVVVNFEFIGSKTVLCQY
jgi:hypothetical protein